jgi:hypothetical protein
MERDKGVFLYDANGECLGSTRVEIDDNDTILPATPGEMVTVVWSDEVGRPTKVMSERLPIIGWRIGEYGAFPITPGNWPQCLVLYTHESGQVQEMTSEIMYDNIDVALNVLLNHFQAVWDKRKEFEPTRATEL